MKKKIKHRKAFKSLDDFCEHVSKLLGNIEVSCEGRGRVIVRTDFALTPTDRGPWRLVRRAFVAECFRRQR